MQSPGIENPQEKLQEVCQRGQDQLSAMQYLDAELTLTIAENLARQIEDWDAMSRLYMPLQESRRQRRQRCGEGKIRLDFVAAGAGDLIDGGKIAREIHHGQILVAGWGSIESAIEARAARVGLYVDVFLAAVYPIGAGKVVAIVPTKYVKLPSAEPMSIDALIKQLPPHSIVMPEAEVRDINTYAGTMALWEKLHAPFLAAADATADAIRRIDAYRQAIRVDYACELAHQKLSDTARKLSTGAKQ